MEENQRLRQELADAKAQKSSETSVSSGSKLRPLVVPATDAVAGPMSRMPAAALAFQTKAHKPTPSAASPAIRPSAAKKPETTILYAPGMDLLAAELREKMGTPAASPARWGSVLSPHVMCTKEVMLRDPTSLVWGRFDSNDPNTVSYTHLTLPTICSV